jgi:hypothetical protein
MSRTLAASRDAYNWSSEPANGAVDTIPDYLLDQQSGAVRCSFAEAWQNYERVTRVLNGGWLRRLLGGRSKLPVVDAVAAKQAFNDWLTPAKVEYAAKENRRDLFSAYDLVITPNAPVSAEQFGRLGDKLARAKGAHFAGAGAVASFTSAQISGYDPTAGALKFALVPTHSTHNMANNAAGQRAHAETLQQQELPGLHAVTPLERLVAWGFPEHDPGAIVREGDATMTHFDLETTINRSPYVLVSTLSSAGDLAMTLASSNSHRRGYLAIG